MKKIKYSKEIIIGAILIIGLAGLWRFLDRYNQEIRILKQVVSRLEADSRVAEVLVTGVNYNENDRKTYTTIKFLEYDASGGPLEPKYFTFSGNIIQFYSLVIRFDDIHIRKGDLLKGKSAYVFWKVFMLDGKNTQEYEITQAHMVPEGYKLKDVADPFERELWGKFWEYALNPSKRSQTGIKNAQIEAPGTMFVPGIIYTIKIEHDGGLRIDTAPLPTILKGERIIE